MYHYNYEVNIIHKKDKKLLYIYIYYLNEQFSIHRHLNPSNGCYFHY